MAYLSLTCLIICVGRSNAEPLLDKEDTESDTPLPNRIVTKGDDTRTFRQITRSASIVDWAEQNVGDTHIRKRKIKVYPRKEKGKKQKVTDKSLIGSDESTPSLIEGQQPQPLLMVMATAEMVEGREVTEWHHRNLSISQV
jgi:hypothetical protein